MNYDLYTIYSTDCLGDALPKINSNFLLFDLLACNAANSNNLIKYNLTNVAADSLVIADAFNYILQNCYIFNNVYEVTKELYKYWVDQQLTVYIPQHYIAPNINNVAEIIRTSFLNKNYTPINYEPFTIINAVKTDFNRAPWLENKITFVTVSDVIQVKELSHSIYRYINLNNKWNFIETINCPVADIPDTLTDATSDKLFLSAYNTQTYETYTTVDISAMLLSTSGTLVPFTAKDYISWEWSINNITASLPVSGKSQNNLSINLESINTISNAANITLFIEQGTFNDVATLSTLNVVAYNYTDTNLKISSIPFIINDRPSKNLLDVYFTVNQGGTIIGDSNITTITRTSRYNSYTLASYVNSKPHTEQYNTLWIINTPTKKFTLSDRVIDFQLREIGLTTITLCAYDVFSEGWGREWDVSRTIKFYQPAAAIFSPEFLVYPTRAWNSTTQQFIDIDSTNFLTYCAAPTAYGYRKDLTESFNISATPGYNLYVWSTSNRILSTTSNTLILNIPYSDGLYLDTGAVISLTAYNDYFPIDGEGVYYKMNSSTYIHPITSSTSNFNNNIFMTSPRIVLHDNIEFVFKLNAYNIDLLTSSKISTTQKISVINSSLPTKIISGNVNYSLYTCDWKAEAVVNIQETDADLFCLKQGDAVSFLTVDPTGITNLRLSAVATAYLHIDDPLNPRDIIALPLSYAPTDI